MSLDFFFNDTATTEIYTLSLHDALPISPSYDVTTRWPSGFVTTMRRSPYSRMTAGSEEHTSGLQAPCKFVCRLPLEKKKLHQPGFAPSAGLRVAPCITHRRLSHDYDFIH